MAYFCKVSGHRINLSKSKLFASRNIQFHRALQLAQTIGISISGDLGKYLGVPLHHKRTTRLTYAPLVLKVQKRLSTWKGSFLNMAGRTVLINSIISTLPSYQMQTTLLPKGVLHDLERLNRNFFWNQEPDSKKMHLIAWESIKKDKKDGGLGIKDLTSQNKALIMKLCWNLITRSDALWVKALRSKYDCGDDHFPRVEKKKNQSAVWKAITSVWDSFRTAVGKKLCSGQSTNAWWDLWTNLDHPLIYYVDRNQNSINPEDMVTHFVGTNGEWDLQRWGMFLPWWVIERIKKVPPPSQSGDDTFWWRKTSDGNFSVKSAYSMIYASSEESSDPFWQRIWRWPIPEKVKFFMWQLFQERIPTNSIRARRDVRINSECPFECHCEETAIHTLRDCEFASSIWLSCINPIYYSAFFFGNLQVWIKWNMKHSPGESKMSQWPWLRVFGSMCWLIWKNRCKRVFEGTNDLPQQLIHRGLHFLHEGIEEGRLKHKIFRVPDRDTVRWNAPPVGFVRIDVDAAVDEYRNFAVGGVIRDSSGAWLCGFQQNIGFTFGSTASEIQAIKIGLQTCKNMNLRNIKLHTDSIEAIQLLFQSGGHYHPLQSEVEEARQLIYRDWDLEIYHCHREGIKCADALAKAALDSITDLSLLDHPPDFCALQMLADLS